MAGNGLGWGDIKSSVDGQLWREAASSISGKRDTEIYHGISFFGNVLRVV